MDKSEFGVIGLGVMGRSLAINLAQKGITLSVYNRHVPSQEEDVAKTFVEEHSGNGFTAYQDLPAFVASLHTPRTILIMVKAGSAVDSVIESLMPYLEIDDLIIDGGNSHFEDTLRRSHLLAERDLLFIGAGISGGEFGARNGCSVMAGGDRTAYDRARKYLEMISARDQHNNPCSVYCGAGGAGHYVKMVHNGIEYAEMQLLAETVFLLRRHTYSDNPAIADLLEGWRQEGQDSYLLKISVDILRKKEGEEFLIDKIADVADQKGTGAWTVSSALSLGVPLDTIAAAVMARALSGKKNERETARQAYQIRYPKIDKTELTAGTLKNACMAARVINHATGFDMLHSASQYYGWSLDLAAIARVWTVGCIIKSGLMNDLVEILTKNKDQNLLVNSDIVERMQGMHADLAKVVAAGLKSGCAVPMMSAAANYFYGFTSGQSSANLIQAQRDYFGAHGYSRTDAPPGQLFHTNWTNSDED